MKANLRNEINENSLSLVCYESLDMGANCIWVNEKKFLITDDQLIDWVKRGLLSLFHLGLLVGSFVSFELLPAYATNQKSRNRIPLSGSELIRMEELIKESIPKALPKSLGKGKRLGSVRDFPKFLCILIAMGKSPLSINQKLNSFPTVLKVQPYPILEKFGIYQPVSTEIIPSNMRKMVSFRGGFVMTTILNPTTLILISGVLFIVGISFLKKINWTQLSEKLKLSQLNKRQKLLLVAGTGVLIAVVMMLFLFLRFKKPFPSRIGIGEPPVFLEPVFQDIPDIISEIISLSDSENVSNFSETLMENVSTTIQFVKEILPKLNQDLAALLQGYEPQIHLGFQRLARELFLLRRNESHSQEKIKELLELLSKTLEFPENLILSGIQSTVEELLKNDEL